MANNHFYFSRQQMKSLNKLSSSLPSYELIGGAESFLLCYISFESICRKIWNFHRSAKANKPINETHASLPLPAIKKAFKEYKIKVSDTVFDNLLNSNKNKRNEKSARELRNGLIHQWKDQDRIEVIKREKELIGNLLLVINVVKNHKY